MFRTDAVCRPANGRPERAAFDKDVACGSGPGTGRERQISVDRWAAPSLRDTAGRSGHASHNVAKLRLELSITVSRLALQPCYGEGLGGAPLAPDFSRCDLQRFQKE